MHHVFVTGAAGFIGSTLVDSLSAARITVTERDNLSTGEIRFLDGALKQPRFELVCGNNRDLPVGGFPMFYAADKTKLRHAMREKCLQEVRFRFDFEGTKVVAQY